MINRESVLRQRVSESIAALQRLLAGPVGSDGVDPIAATADAAARIAASLRAGGKVMFFGNGGSASDASHLAAELLGRFALERQSLAAACLSDHTAAMTAIGNDYAYEDVFARQLAGLGRRGDVAVGLSTSGTSANVVRPYTSGLRVPGRTQGLSPSKTGSTTLWQLPQTLEERTSGYSTGLAPRL